MHILRLLSALAAVSLLAGCASMDQLSRVGEAPKLSAIENPTAQPGYKQVNMPMPEIVPVGRVVASRGALVISWMVPSRSTGWSIPAIMKRAEKPLLPGV